MYNFCYCLKKLPLIHQQGWNTWHARHPNPRNCTQLCYTHIMLHSCFNCHTSQNDAPSAGLWKLQIMSHLVQHTLLENITRQWWRRIFLPFTCLKYCIPNRHQSVSFRLLFVVYLSLNRFGGVWNALAVCEFKHGSIWLLFSTNIHCCILRKSVTLEWKAT